MRLRKGELTLALASFSSSASSRGATGLSFASIAQNNFVNLAK
jgi:hypothetical protein